MSVPDFFQGLGRLVESGILGEPDVLFCPSDKFKTNKDDHWPWKNPPSVDLWYYCSYTSREVDQPIIDGKQPSRFKLARLGKKAYAGEVFTGSFPHVNHVESGSPGWNVVFLDGSVKWIKYDGYLENASWPRRYEVWDHLDQY